MLALNRPQRTVRDYCAIICKRKVLSAAFFCLVMVSAVLTCAGMPAWYEARAKLMPKNGAGVETAKELLTSAGLMEKTVRTLRAENLYPPMSESRSDDTRLVDRVLENFQKQVRVSGDAVITVSFRHRKPAFAARAVDILVEQFQDYYRRLRDKSDHYDFFTAQKELSRKQLESSQRELGLFRNDNNISSIQKQKSLLLLQISDLQLEQAKARADISEQESLASQQAGGSADRQKTLVALHAKSSKLGQQITRYTLQLGRLDKAETRLQDLERQVKLDEDTYLLYTKKAEEARIASAMEAKNLANFTVVESARIPVVQIKRHKLLILLVAAGAALLGALLLPFLIEHFSHTFDYAADVERVLKCPAVASVPLLERQKPETLFSAGQAEEVQVQMSRVYQYINRRVVGTSKTKTVLLCSSRRHEGTSWVAAALAAHIASPDERVLLVDANMQAPSLHRMFDLEQENGLSDMLAGESSLEQTIKKTGVLNLSVITGGSTERAREALLHHDAIERITDGIDRFADWMLIDAPAINVSDEGAVITKRAHMVLMVIEAGKTRWEVADNGVSRFNAAGARELAVILNKQKRHIPEWLYKALW